MISTLYHYGSNRRCFGILKDREFRMSDIRKSNDYRELLMLYPEIFDIILDKYKQAPFPFKYEHLDSVAAMQALVYQTEDMIDHELDSGDFSNFVTCFSETPDMLSQWRGYANDGKGCCLGFSFDALKEYCDNSNGVLLLEEVRYVTKDELSEIAVQTATDILSELKGLRKWIVENMTFDDDADDTDGLLGFNFHGMIENTLTDSLVLKSSGFSEEKEWRLFLATQAYKKPEWVLGEAKKIGGPRGFEETLSYLRNNIQFNITEDNISPYVTIRFRDFASIPVCEFWLGPKSQISKCDLELFLAKEGYLGLKICESNISYR